MTESTQPSNERIDLLLRASRRSLMLVLVFIALVAATFLAHALRPGTLLADWPAKVPWLIPLVIVFFVVTQGRRRPNAAELEAVLGDEFRQVNLARAQRLTLFVVIAAQFPLLALSLTNLEMSSAVTVMAVSTVAIGMVTLITSFLVFDRE